MKTEESVARLLPILLIAVLLLIPLSVFSQKLQVNKQQKFPHHIPAGNYSGITAIGNERYAVVCDKSDDGFFVFHIDIDTLSGRILSVQNEGFHPSGCPNRDQEGISFQPFTRTLFISGEADNQIMEYTLDGHRRSAASTATMGSSRCAMMTRRTVFIPYPNVRPRAIACCG